MYLTKPQVAGLQWAAGQSDVKPRSNTLDSLHSRNLLTVSAGSLHVLTDAGRAELLERESAAKAEPDEETAYAEGNAGEREEAERIAAQIMDEPQHGETKLAIDPGTPPGFALMDDVSGLQANLMHNLVPSVLAVRNPISKRRAKNRVARKSRKINRQRRK